MFLVLSEIVLKPALNIARQNLLVQLQDVLVKIAFPVTRRYVSVYKVVSPVPPYRCVIGFRTIDETYILFQLLNISCPSCARSAYENYF